MRPQVVRACGTAGAAEIVLARRVVLLVVLLWSWARQRAAVPST
jgi:uncharacterized membrane protein YtjA (UPF0391 family)